MKLLKFGYSWGSCCCTELGLNSKMEDSLGSSDSEKELKHELLDVGIKLLSPPSSIHELLTLLDVKTLSLSNHFFACFRFYHFLDFLCGFSCFSLMITHFPPFFLAF